MSWEAWGTPPDREPEQEPEPNYMVPPIGPCQQWTCANGCGACAVKTIDFEWRTITDMRTGKVIQRDTYPIDVSSCCGAELLLWDEDKQDTVDWQPVVRPPANFNSTADPAA